MVLSQERRVLYVVDRECGGVHACSCINYTAVCGVEKKIVTVVDGWYEYELVLMMYSRGTS